MGVLPAQTIKDLCKTANLVTPWKNVRIKGASYDLTVGDSYYVHNGKDVNSGIHEDFEFVEIPASGVALVVSDEVVKMPEDLTATVSLRNRFVTDGIILPSQTPIDPGIEGKIYALLYNLSDKPVLIKKGQRFLTVVFHRLEEPTTKPYDGDYTIQKVRDVIHQPINASLRQIRDEMKSTRGRLEKILPILMVAIVIIVGLNSALLTYLIISGIL